MTALPEIVRAPLLDKRVFDQTAKLLGLRPAGVERLVAIDRVLRSLLAAGVLTDWALAGPTALHGVYAWQSRRVGRVPDELVVAPTVPQPAIAYEEIVACMAAALPDGAVRNGQGVLSVTFRGTTGDAVLPVRKERPLFFQPPRGGQRVDAAFAVDAVAAGAEAWGRGWLADPRLPYLSHVGRPLPDRARGESQQLRVAFVEEVLLEATVALMDTRSRDGSPFTAGRVDDLRMALRYDAEATAAILGGTVLAWWRAYLAKRNPDAAAVAEQLAQIRGTIVRIARANPVEELPAEVRPIEERADRDAELRFLRALLDALAGWGASR